MQPLIRITPPSCHGKSSSGRPHTAISYGSQIINPPRNIHQTAPLSARHPAKHPAMPPRPAQSIMSTMGKGTVSSCEALVACGALPREDMSELENLTGPSSNGDPPNNRAPPRVDKCKVLCKPHRALGPNYCVLPLRCGTSARRSCRNETTAEPRRPDPTGVYCMETRTVSKPGCVLSS